MAPFSPQDAQALMAVARTAPLANMTAAEQLAGILNRFAEHCVAHFAPPPPPPAE